MREATNILDIGNMQPDFMGFIFYNKSPRFVGADFAMPGLLDKNVKRVGVFVNTDVSDIISTIGKHKLDMVQLHGDESTELCQKVKSQAEVIKVFSIDDTFNFNVVKPYEAVVDYFLFDTKGPQRGGNGVAFDWRALRNYKGDVPFFLSGGINSNNAAFINEINHPRLFAIDVNSGIEIRPGLKDPSKFNELNKIIKSI